MSINEPVPFCEQPGEYNIPWLHATRVPLLFGPMRGKYWLPFSRGKVLRLLLGSYEPDQTTMMKELLRPGHVLFDVGAAVGYYTVLAAPLVGDEGRVVAFEPDPKNAAYLRKHVAINRLTNVTVHQTAVGNLNGRAKFAGGSGTGTGRLTESGTTTVGICRLDDFVATAGFPTHIKIDVEGAELDVLRGARQTLTSARPTIFLSTHGSKVYHACHEYLTELDYNLLPISADPKYASEVLCLAKEAFNPVVTAA
jgi:FkbM family methyltransferase